MKIVVYILVIAFSLNASAQAQVNNTVAAAEPATLVSAPSAPPQVAAPQAASASQSAPVPQLTTPASVIATPLAPASPPAPPTIAVPADIASLTAKEILAANNQVVAQVASMYQHLGLFITIIITLVGIAVTVIGYFARKSVHELIAEWKIKLASTQDDMQKTKDKLTLAVTETETKAANAAKDAQSLNDGVKILQQALTEVDQLRTRVAQLADELQKQQAQQLNGSASQPAANQEQAADPVSTTEAALTHEANEVSKLLSGKVDN